MAALVRLDARGLKARHARIRALGPHGRRRALAVAVHPVVAAVLAAAPRDTQRYAYGWATAGNQAGIGPFSEPVIRDSRFKEQMFTRLENEQGRFEALARRAAERLAYWEHIVQTRYVATGRTKGYWYRWTLTKRDRAERLLAKMRARVEEITSDLRELSTRTGVITIFRRRGKNGLGRTVTIRPRVFGGTGRWIDLGHQTILRLHNREPHASIVEARSKSLRAAHAAMKAAGVLPMKRVYLAAVDRVRSF